MARIQTNRAANRIVQEVIIRSPKGLKERRGIIRAVEKSLIIRMFIYSAIKINAKPPALYSILKPETSSDSPSGRSNGVRLVSARRVMNHIRQTGARRRGLGVDIVWVIWVKSYEREVISNVIKIRAILTS